MALFDRLATAAQWTDIGSYMHPNEATADNVVIGGDGIVNGDIILGVDGSAIFNENGDASDFRLGGDNITSLLYTDALNDRVGINTSSASTQLEVNGSLSSTVLNGIELNTALVTATVFNATTMNATTLSSAVPRLCLSTQLP